MIKFYICMINAKEGIIFQERFEFEHSLEEAAYRMAKKHGRVILATSPEAAMDTFALLDKESS